MLNTSAGINGLLGMSLNRDTVVFSAEAVGSGGANTGVWSAPANVNTTESQLHLNADASTVYRSRFPPGCASGFCQTINQWEGGFIGATAIAFTGGGQVGADGLCVHSPSSLILLSSIVLPGDTADNAAYPINASFYMGPIVDDNNVFFLAMDPFYMGTCANGAFACVFKTSLAGGTATSIMNTCNTQPKRRFAWRELLQSAGGRRRNRGLPSVG
jgi:hypothetical protein